LLICIVVAAPGLLAVKGVPLYLGVLEPRLAQMPQSSQQFHVRIAFRFQDGRWSAMPHDAADEDALAKFPAQFPPQVSWTIAKGGKKLGNVLSTRPPQYSRYSDIGREDLVAGSNPPQVRDDAAKFATWMGAAHYRPLVAISEPNYSDPDNWERVDASEQLHQPAVAAFRAAIALDLNCDGKATRSYPDAAIEIYGKPYRSRRGDVLIAMRPDPNRNRCEGPAGDQWQSAWFLVKEGKFRRVGDGLTLLDIGDYSGEGVSLILFQSDGYDRDGYLLLDPRTGSTAEFSWSYQ
jgi:hypothetical protein